MRRLLFLLAALTCLIGMAQPAGAFQDLTAYQWGLQQVHAPAAWSVSSGAGVTVGVIDTGADAGHPDFGGRVSTIDCTNTGGSASNCRAGGDDRHGHGTHVTGIIAAANDGSGTAGVAPNTRVIAANVFTCTEPCGPPNGADPGATLDDVSAGIDYLLSRGVVAINMSLGDGGTLGLFCNNSRFGPMLEKIWSAGAVPVFAAGNCGSGIGGGSGNYSGIHALIVKATGPTGSEATGYSSSTSSAMWGLAAPGGDGGTCSADGSNCILSTWPRFKNPTQPYYLYSGTSQATPHVTGAVADLRSKGLSQQAAVDAIMHSLDPMSCGTGCQGRLNVQNAVGAASVTPPTTATTALQRPKFASTPTTARRATTPRTTPTAPTTTVTIEAPTTTTEPPTTTTARVTQAALPKHNSDASLPLLPVVLGIAGLASAAAATSVAGLRNRRGPRGGEAL